MSLHYERRPGLRALFDLPAPRTDLHDRLPRQPRSLVLRIVDQFKQRPASRLLRRPPVKLRRPRIPKPHRAVQCDHDERIPRRIDQCRLFADLGLRRASRREIEIDAVHLQFPVGLLQHHMARKHRDRRAVFFPQDNLSRRDRAATPHPLIHRGHDAGPALRR